MNDDTSHDEESSMSESTSESDDDMKESEGHSVLSRAYAKRSNVQVSWSNVKAL